jgi:hypothetical protein
VLQRAVDLVGELVVGAVVQCPAGAAGAVAVQRERRFKVAGRDRSGAVDQGVEQREADRVGFGACADRAGDPGLGLGEPGVGVPPQLASVVVELQLAGAAGGSEVLGESVFERRVVERVVLAAFGQQPDAAAGDQQEAVEEAVGEFDGAGVVAQLGGRSR